MHVYYSLPPISLSKQSCLLCTCGYGIGLDTEQQVSQRYVLQLGQRNRSIAKGNFVGAEILKPSAKPAPFMEYRTGLGGRAEALRGVEKVGDTNLGNMINKHKHRMMEEVWVA